VWQTLVEQGEGWFSHSRLSLWRAVVLHSACANILLRFYAWPWFHIPSAKSRYEFGALFFLPL